MARKIRNEKFTITVDGTTGSAQTNNPISGNLVALHLDYSSGMANTCNVTITRKSDGAIPSEDMLTVFNVNTDGWYRPRAHLVDENNVPLLGVHDYFRIAGYVSASVAQGTNTETVTITLLYEAE